jgi:hypothetical protein
MKNSLVFFLLCLGSAAAVYAEHYAVPVLVSAPDTNIVKTITGSIDAVSIADAAKGLRSEIIIACHDGAQHVLIVKATTTIYDAAWKPTGLAVLQKKDRVRIKYVTTGEGFAEALSIKQLKTELK